jgi:PhoPQ-activated pathogenicity-related protein
MISLKVSILVLTFFLVFFGGVCILPYVYATPLDDYVNLPDPTFNWTLKTTKKSLSYTIYGIVLTSQTWLTPEDTDHPVWTHWLTVCVPNKILYKTAFLYINGGSNVGGQPREPSQVDSIVEILCGTNQVIVSELQQIPNQPIVFSADPQHKKRSEDAFIAFTWWHFINNVTQPYWLARMPMTKAVVRAMDTIQEFSRTLRGVPAVENFMVAGASKRGWTTWTTAAVDKRVIAFVPIVIPILNMVPNINMMWMSLGEWTFAFDDYVEMGLLHYLNLPPFQEMANIIDPLVYASRYIDKPKYIISSCNDEFFIPDSSRLFWDQLPGPKWLRMVPDAEHSLYGQQVDVTLSISTFVHMLLENRPQPKLNWTLIRSNKSEAAIILHTETKPKSVYMWYASTLSAKHRDFRLVVCRQIPECINPVIWYFTKLEETSPGVYIARQRPPLYGWTAFLIEAIYEIPSNNDPLNPFHQFKVTTEVNIVPDILPFPNCGLHCQPNN